VRWVLRLSLAILALGNLAGAEAQRYEAVEAHMGTLVRITLYASGEQPAKAAFRAAFDRIRDLDRILSDYRPDSELNRVTAEAVSRPVPVSPDLFRVLAASQDLAEATGGAFDVTQGPVIRLWRHARTTARLPGAAALQEAASRTGFRKLHLDADRRTVTVDAAGMALDVGGIGKGYAASEALAVLDALGVRSALVAVSGDLAFSDPPPGESGWRIGLDVDDRTAGIPGVLELSHAAVSTSGSREQHVDIDGRRYSHIIDPASRLGLTDDITVTVIAPYGLEADGLDTAISVLGPARGLALVESRPAAAALITVRSRSGTVVSASSRFRDIVSRQQPQMREP
jgi:thiamine biosynthesis lipoprotein